MVCKICCVIVCLNTKVFFSSHMHQVIQEESVGESGGTVCVQRLRLSDGDDRPSQTAQLHSWRGDVQI